MPSRLDVTERMTAIGVVGATLLLAVMMPTVPVAVADAPTICTGPIGGEGVTFDRVVAPGPSCSILPGTTVSGDVHQGGGILFIAGDVSIGGSLQVEGGETTQVQADAGPTSIGGNVQIEMTTGLTRIEDVTVGGNMQIEDKLGGVIDVNLNNVGGNIQIEGNVITGFIHVIGNAVDGDVQIEGNEVISAHIVDDNTIGGNLQCEENDLAPTLGGLALGNTVAGNKKGQCAGL